VKENREPDDSTIQGSDEAPSLFHEVVSTL
jgi:hypothetical protein